jgi:FAD:protein FMN transferase
MHSTSVKNKVFLVLFLFSIITLCISWKLPTKEDTPKVYTSQFENVLGTSFEMKVTTTSTKEALAAEEIALNEINRLSKILSAYDAQSEFSIWMRSYNTPIKASKELIEVLSLFDKWRFNTEGVLNPAFDVVSKLWENAEKEQTLPTKEAIQNAVKIANETHWKIDYKNGTITHITNVPLKLNTFVKSYIIDHATKKVIEKTNATDVVMNIGGDILVSGNQSEMIEITNPKASAINDASIDMVKIQNKFIATSGNYKRGHLINNEWYSHIINPKTGLPANDIISATVIANNATDAGALATAFNIMSIEESIQLAKQFPDVAYLIINKDGERIENDNWKSVEIRNQSNTNAVVAKDGQWNPAYELTISLELMQFNGPYRRPFVAIWIEDKDKTPVKNLLVWYNKPKWLRDMKAWYRANYSNFNVESQTINSISSATRPAGKYDIKWDGKNDKGEYVKEGTYTVNIEVVREHGTYQLITQDIKINNKASKFKLPANPEVASASLEIKKK